MFPSGDASSRMPPYADGNSKRATIPNLKLPHSPVRPQPPPNPVPSSSRCSSRALKKGVRATIFLVDYADDENVSSPESHSELLDASYAQTDTINSKASLTKNDTEKESDARDACQNNDTSIKMQEDVDLLKNFLPPPPTTRCSQELQEKIRKFLAVRRVGKRFNDRLRNMRAYRNPDFLQHAVQYQEINQMGTCFRKDVFNPEGYDESDYYDKIGY